MVLNISCFAVVLRGFSQDCLIYAKLIIVFTPNLQFSLYSEFIHGSITFKLEKGQQRLKKNFNYSLYVFDLSFNKDNKCYKQNWGMLFFTHIKLVAYVLVCAWAMARIKWKRKTYDRVLNMLGYSYNNFTIVNVIC